MRVRFIELLYFIESQNFLGKFPLTLSKFTEILFYPDELLVFKEDKKCNTFTHYKH